jgi:hypothetical protein
MEQRQEGPFLFGNAVSLAESNAAPFVQCVCTVLPALTGPMEYHHASDAMPK